MVSPGSEPTRMLRRKVQELNALIEVSTRITSHMALEPLLQTVVDAARELIGAEMGGLLVLDPEAPGRYEYFTVSGWPGPAGFPEGRGIFALPHKTGSPLRVATLPEHPLSVGTPAGHPPVGAFLAVPLAMRDRILGSLFLAHEPGGALFTTEDEELLLAFSTQAAIAIDNARLYSKSEELAVLKERTRISQQLHDSVSQILFALGIEVDQALKGLRANQHAAIERLIRAKQLAAEGASEIRAAIFSLAQDTDLGRPASLVFEDLVQHFEQESGIRTTLVTRGSLDMVPRALAACAGKIISESLTNVRRHSQSSVAFVAAGFDGETLVVSIQDAGQGIDDDALAGPTGLTAHYGLHAMRSLVEEFGGDFSVFRNDEGGTTVRVQLPRKAPHE